MTRPRRLDPLALQEFLAAMGRGSTVDVAAFVAGLNQEDLRALRKRDHEFATRWMDAVAVGIDTLEDELLAIGKSGDERSSMALAFLLARRMPERYGHVVGVDVSAEATPTIEDFIEVHAAFAAGLRDLVDREA